MLYLPPDPKPGEPIRADTLTAILKYLRQITLRGGIGTNVQIGSGGATISVIQQRRPGRPLNAPDSRNLFVYDASTGSTPRIGVTPGTIQGITPTIDGNPINVKTGAPLAYPLLTCSPGDQMICFQLDYDDTNTLVTVEILSCTLATFEGYKSGVAIVPGTAGTDYYGLSTINALAGPPASTSPLNDYVSGNQGYAQCGNASNCWLM